MRRASLPSHSPRDSLTSTEREMLDHCTFRPQITPRRSTTRRRRCRPLHERYELEMRTRSNRIAALREHAAECHASAHPFRPKISHPSRSSDSKDSFFSRDRELSRLHHSATQSREIEVAQRARLRQIMKKRPSRFPITVVDSRSVRSGSGGILSSHRQRPHPHPRPPTFVPKRPHVSFFENRTNFLPSSTSISDSPGSGSGSISPRIDSLEQRELENCTFAPQICFQSRLLAAQAAAKKLSECESPKKSKPALERKSVTDAHGHGSDSGSGSIFTRLFADAQKNLVKKKKNQIPVSVHQDQPQAQAQVQARCDRLYLESRLVEVRRVVAERKEEERLKQLAEESVRASKTSERILKRRVEFVRRIWDKIVVHGGGGGMTEDGGSATRRERRGRRTVSVSGRGGGEKKHDSEEEEEVEGERIVEPKVGEVVGDADADPVPVTATDDIDASSSSGGESNVTISDIDDSEKIDSSHPKPLNPPQGGIARMSEDQFILAWFNILDLAERKTAIVRHNTIPDVDVDVDADADDSFFRSLLLSDSDSTPKKTPAQVQLDVLGINSSFFLLQEELRSVWTDLEVADPRGMTREEFISASLNHPDLLKIRRRRKKDLIARERDRILKIENRRKRRRRLERERLKRFRVREEHQRNKDGVRVKENESHDGDGVAADISSASSSSLPSFVGGKPTQSMYGNVHEKLFQESGIIALKRRQRKARAHRRREEKAKRECPFRPKVRRARSTTASFLGRQLRKGNRFEYLHGLGKRPERRAKDVARERALAERAKPVFRTHGRGFREIPALEKSITPGKKKANPSPGGEKANQQRRRSRGKKRRRRRSRRRDSDDDDDEDDPPGEVRGLHAHLVRQLRAKHKRREVDTFFEKEHRRRMDRFRPEPTVVHPFAFDRRERERKNVASGSDAPVLRLEITIRETNETGFVDVRYGDSPGRLARVFAGEHDLDRAREKKIERIIRQNMEFHEISFDLENSPPPDPLRKRRLAASLSALMDDSNELLRSRIQ